MHDVPELVEERHAVRVAQKRGLAVGRGSWQITKHAVDGNLIAPALQEVEDSRMPVLAVPGMEVEVEEALLLLRFHVDNAEQAHRGVPRVELVDLDEFQAEQLLVDLERRLYDVVQGKVGAYGLVVDALRGSGIETTPRRWRVSA